MEIALYLESEKDLIESILKTLNIKFTTIFTNNPKVINHYIIRAEILPHEKNDLERILILSLKLFRG